MAEPSKSVASVQILKIAFICNWKLLSYSSTWCRHEHDAQISVLAVADDFLPERRRGQISVPVLFLSARTSLSVPAAVARSLGPLTPDNTEQAVWDFTPKASSVRLQPPLSCRSEVSSWSSFLLPLSAFYISSINREGLGPSLGLFCGDQVWP